MKHQTTFAHAEFTAKKKPTRRERFLTRMEEVIAPYYPKGARDRPPIGLERMLRAISCSSGMRWSTKRWKTPFTTARRCSASPGSNSTRRACSDATTLLKFRRLLETHDLRKALFTAINADLAARGLLLREGTLVDATLIAAPSSTKNEKRARDPEMHQTKKGNQWYFGLKAHIGADRDRKLVHTVVVTAATVADLTQTAQLLHGDETQVHADAGYRGVEKRPEIVALARPIDWQIACKPGLIKALTEGTHKEAIKAIEHAKAAVRAFVEHPFHLVKNLFGHRKTRYRGLAKNTHQLHTLFGLANVMIAARRVAA